MNTNISNKTLQDLEFTTVLQQVAEHCITGLGKKRVLSTVPIISKKELLKELKLVDEYLSSYESENIIPNHGFDDIIFYCFTKNRIHYLHK